MKLEKIMLATQQRCFPFLPEKRSSRRTLALSLFLTAALFLSSEVFAPHEPSVPSLRKVATELKKRAQARQGVLREVSASSTHQVHPALKALGVTTP